MRVFIGIPLPSHVKETIQSIKPMIEPNIRKGRWTRLDNLHITLVFIGEVSTDDIESISILMDQTLHQQSRFPISMADIGMFNKGQHSIVWLGINQGREHLRHLSSVLKHELKSHHYSFDEKPLVPHLTLVRQATLANDLNIPKFESEIGWDVEEIHLYLSHQVDGVLTYQPLHTIHLK